MVNDTKVITDFSDIYNENIKYKKKIILTPEGGIGNRINLINFFYPYANKLKRKVYVNWKKTKGLNCDFKTLFYLPEFNLYSNNFNNKKINVYTSNISNGTEYMETFIKNKKHIHELEYDKDDIVEFTAFELKSKQNFFYKKLKPGHIVKKQIDNFFPKNKKIIGIHIRCSDRFNCLKQPLLNNIKKTIHDIHNKYPEYLLFLATDDVEIRNILKKNI